jgi:hypothetical protein
MARRELLNLAALAQRDAASIDAAGTGGGD